MKDLSSFSHYHPSWEGRDFTQDEYESLLKDLSKKKAHEGLLIDGQSIKIANTITKMWQTIKGWVGLENQTDPIKVNYELLKLLRYGEAHHYLNKTKIKIIILNFAKALEHDKNNSYEKIIKIIHEILPIESDEQATTLVDREINIYYEANQKCLKEAFWSHFLHKLIPSLKQNSARVHYNQAKIYQKEGHHTEAILSLEKALEILPNQSYWQLTLAKLLLTEAEHQASTEALNLSTKALKTALEITIAPDVSSTELQEVVTQAYLSCCLLNVKEGNDKAAFEYLEKCPKPQADLFKVYQHFVKHHPQYKPDDLQEVEFFIFASGKDSPSPQQVNFLQAALKKLESFEPSVFFDQKIIKTHLMRVDCYIKEKMIDEAKQALDSAWMKLKELRNSQDTTVFNQFSQLFEGKAKLLLNTIAPTDLQTSLVINSYLKDLYKNDPHQCAITCQSLAQLYSLLGNDRLALNELQHAAKLKGTDISLIKPLMECHSKLADQALAKEQFQELFSHLEEMLYLTFDKSEIIRKLFIIGKQIEKKYPKEAAQAYKIAINADQTHALDSEQLIHAYQLIASEDLGRKDDSQLTLANLCLKQGKFSEALPLFQQLNKTSPREYQGQIHDCYIGLALKNEGSHPGQAIDQYQQSFALASNDQKQATASRLLSLGDALIKTGQNTLALKCFTLGIESAPFIDSLPQQLTGEAYRYLARANIQEKEYGQASTLYQKALTILPNKVDLLLEYAEYEYSQGNLEQASCHYRKAMFLEPAVPLYKQKLMTTELAAADKNYRRGIHDPQRVRQLTLDLIKKATSPDSPHAKKIEKALMSWLGKNFGDNCQLKTLAIKASSPFQIDKDAKKACELIEKAYDGNWLHMKPEEMPLELTKAIHSLREEITDMRAYYEILQMKTERLVQSLQSTTIAETFSSLSLAPKLKNLKDAQTIEGQARTILKILAKVKQQHPLAITPALEQGVKTLQQFSLPSGWMYLAIEHYCNVLELNPDVYGDHCNKLIDAYVKVGDYINAIATYEKLKAAFPKAPLRIDPTIYSKMIEIPQTQISNQQIVDGLINAGNQKAQERNYTEAIAIFNQALNIATPQQTVQIATRLLNLGDILINSASRKDAIKAYESLIPHLLSLSQDKQVDILSLLGNEAKLAEKYEEALNYYRNALSINPNDVKLHEETGDLYALQKNPEKALIHYQKASQLEPSNSVYLQRMTNMEIAIGDLRYMQGLINIQNRELTNFIQLVTNEAPYANKIETSLGHYLGGFSTDNQKLSNLIASKNRTAKEMITDTRTVIELVKKAYDGENHHMKPREMPELLKIKLETLEALQSSLKKLMPANQTMKASSTLDDPLSEAIAYYERANTRFPLIYGEHYNRLIDAHLILKDPSKALALYKEYKAAFSTNAIKIEPIAYQLMIDDNIKKQNYDEALKLINEAFLDFGNYQPFQILKSRYYFNLGEIDFKNKDYQQALDHYLEATKCGVIPEITTYLRLAKIFKMASNDEVALKEMERSHFSYATLYLKAACDLEPDNAELKFQLGRLVYVEPDPDIRFNVRKYFEDAIRLEPNNIVYVYALKSWIESRESYAINAPQYKKIRDHFNKLGGVPTYDNEHYWTDHNPYEL